MASTKCIFGASPLVRDWSEPERHGPEIFGDAVDQQGSIVSSEPKAGKRTDPTGPERANLLREDLESARAGEYPDCRILATGEETLSVSREQNAKRPVAETSDCCQHLVEVVVADLDDFRTARFCDGDSSIR